MSEVPPASLNRQTFRRLGHAMVMFLRSDAGGKAKFLLAMLLALMFGINGMNYLIQLIPLVIVAPLFMRGDIEFGVIGQSAMAFATLLGAFSLVITRFQSISSYASVVMRLGESVENAEKEVGPLAGKDTP